MIETLYHSNFLQQNTTVFCYVISDVSIIDIAVHGFLTAYHDLFDGATKRNLAIDNQSKTNRSNDLQGVNFIGNLKKITDLPIRETKNKTSRSGICYFN